MKTFDKSSKLEHVAYDIRGPVLDEANRMIAKVKRFFVLIREILRNLALQHRMKSFVI